MNKFLQDSPSSMFSTGLWEDEAMLDSHSMEDIFCLICLLTNPSRHVSGILKLNTRILCAHLRWDKQQLEIVLNRLEKHGDVLVRGGWVWVKSHYDHNSFSPSHQNKILNRLCEVPDEMKEAWFLDARERGFWTLPIGSQDPTETHLPNNNYNDNKKENKNQKNNDNHGKVGGAGLSFPDLPEEIIIELRREVSTLAESEAQKALNELTNRLSNKDANPLANPVSWLRKIIKSGIVVTPGGIAIAEKRERRNAEGDRILDTNGNLKDQKSQAFGAQMMQGLSQKRASQR